MLGGKLADFAMTDTVFPRAGPVHLQCPGNQPVIQRDGAADLFGIVRVEHHIDMKVAIADMTDNRRDQAGLLDILAGLRDTFGQP